MVYVDTSTPVLIPALPLNWLGDLGPIPSSRELHFLSVGLSALWFKLISDSGVVTTLDLRQPHGGERRTHLVLFLVFLECELSVGEGLWETRLGEELGWARGCAPD